MRKSKTGPFTPLQNRTTYPKLSEGTLSHGATFSILFNTTKTKALSSVGETVLRRCASQGHIPYYHLETLTTLEGETRYQLKSDKRLISPVGKFAYVILELSAGRYELRIGNMHHFYLANKSHEVVAAGDIEFIQYKDGFSDISSINNQSGGYHLSDEDELIREFKRLSCEEILKTVGLPLEKYHPCPYTKANQDNDKIKSKRRQSI